MNYIFHNFGWKVLSVLVAFGFWFMVMSSNSIEISKEVGLEIDVPPGLVVANDMPDRITFRLSGSKFFLRTLANSLDSIHVDLSHAKAGPAYYMIEKEALHLPIGVKILSISPSTINPILETVDHRTVPVELDTKNKVPPGYKLVKMQAIPDRVHIRGPKNQLEKIQSIKSGPIDLSDIKPSLKWEIPISTGFPGVSFEEELEPRVLVEVEPTGSNFRVAGVPLQVEGEGNYSMSADKVALYVNCPPSLIKTITPDKVRAFIKAGDVKGGASYTREIRVSLPSGVSLVRVVPDRVQLRLMEH